MIKAIEKASLGEMFHNGIYTTELFDFETNKKYQVYIEYSLKTESDIYKMIKIADGEKVNEFSPNFDFLKEIIKKYAIQV